MSHIPVMLGEVLCALNINPNGTYIDCTFGRGGHARAIIDKLVGGKLIALDRDENAVEFAHQTFRDDLASGKLQIFQEKFSNLSNILKIQNIAKADGIFADLGVSSPQIDDTEMGFSYMSNGPLKMTMGLNTQSAYDFTNSATEDEISRIIFEFSQERYSKKIAREIIAKRRIAPLETTFDLRDAVFSVIFPPFQIKSCARVFQAIRMHINDELNELKIFLSNAHNTLSRDGILAILSFHSLEDTLVKRFFQIGAFDHGNSRWNSQISPTNKKNDNFEKHHRIFASENEIAANARSRSAILRWAKRT